LYLISRGAYIAIHNNTHLPNTQFEGITVPTGQVTNVKIDRNYYYDLGSPYSSCRKDVTTILDSDSDHLKNTLTVNGYSQLLCYELCFDSKVIQTYCNCTDPSVPYKPDNVSVCYSLDDIYCIKTQRAALDTTPISRYCVDDCPRECDSVYYDASTSFSYYPSDYYSDYLNNLTSFQNKFNNEDLRFTLPDNGGGGANKNGAPPAVNHVIGRDMPLNVVNSPPVDRKNEIPETVCQINFYYGELSYKTIDESASLTFSALFGVFGK
jgi:hypothetical protein